MSDYNEKYVNYTNDYSTSDFSLEKMLEAKKKIDEINRKILRSSSEMVEATTCSVCGRKPTVINQGFGDTIVVCPHIMAEIKKLSKQEHKSEQLFGLDTLNGIRVEEFDDGPRRW